MHQFRKTISALSIIFSVTLMGEYKISIIYESGFEFKSQHLLINDLKECSSKKEIENLVSDQDWIKERSMSYRNLCFQKEKRFVHERIGWNYRMTNLQAAVGLAQLERLDEFTAIKRSIGTRYHNALKDCRGLQLPIPETNFAKNIYWVFSLVIKQESGLNVNKLNELLHAKNIGTRPFFYPMHKQPIFQSMGLFENESYPNSEKISSTGIYIPSGMALKDHDLEYVIQTIFDIMNYEVKLD